MDGGALELHEYLRQLLLSRNVSELELPLGILALDDITNGIGSRCTSALETLQQPVRFGRVLVGVLDHHQLDLQRWSIAPSKARWRRHVSRHQHADQRLDRIERCIELVLDGLFVETTLETLANDLGVLQQEVAA